MYKLLLVTDNQTVRDVYGQIPSWEALGFRQPRLASSCDEAMETLSRHHADGILIHLEEAEWRRILEDLNAYPLKPVLRAADSLEQALSDLNELETLLNKTHADYSNDRYDEATMMQLCRHQFFRRLLEGKQTDPQGVLRYLLLLRSKMDPLRPCMLMELGTPQRDHYLEGHWHYGADRLEVAMRNIFGAELRGMRILISVLQDERIFLVACPMIGFDAPTGQEMEKLVIDHAESAIQHIRDYLDIELNVAAVRKMNTLLDLAPGGVVA